MNVFILTQEDAFYIPKLLEIFYQEKPPACAIVGAAVLKGEIAGENVGAYLRLLGPAGFAVNGFHFARHKVMDTLGRVVQTRQAYSVQGWLRRHRIACYKPDKINDAAFHRLLQDLEVDLLISVACPQIVRRELLDLPPKGVINIHGALLPKYRGKLPSFWVLANGEQVTGVSVHYMNEKLDDGPIIVQRKVPIDPEDTLHSLVLKSKVEYGGQALAEAIAHIANDTVTVQSNDKGEATYYSFPTVEAIQAFRRRGRKIR